MEHLQSLWTVDSKFRGNRLVTVVSLSLQLGQSRVRDLRGTLAAVNNAGSTLDRAGVSAGGEWSQGQSLDGS